jgi:hypothetical protein
VAVAGPVQRAPQVPRALLVQLGPALVRRVPLVQLGRLGHRVLLGRPVLMGRLVLLGRRVLRALGLPVRLGQELLEQQVRLVIAVLPDLVLLVRPD